MEPGALRSTSLAMIPIKRRKDGTQGPSFEAALKPHLRPLYRVAYRLTGRREDAEDLVQDLLAKVYARRDELLEVNNLRPWLMRVMYRLFIDGARQRSRSPLHLVATSPIGPDQDTPADPLGQLAGDDDPARDVEHDARTDALVLAISRLSTDHQRVVALHDVEGYTLEEIQVMLDCPIGTLKSRLHRARARLRDLLAGSECAAEEPDASSARPRQRA